MRKMIVILTLVSLILAACTQSAESGEDAESLENVACSSSGYKEIAGEYLEEWESVIVVTLQRFPGALSVQISDLERIMEEYKNLDLADCYQPAHDRYLAGMALDFEGVKEFDETGDVGEQFELADSEYAAAEEELKKLDE